MPFHSLSPASALGELGSDAFMGLSQGQAAERLDRYGPNELVQARKRTLLQMFLEQFADLLVAVLIVAALVSGFLGEWLDAVAILAIVFLNAVVGFVQEYKAEAALEALKKMVAPQARVLRDGREQRISARELVPGDLILLEAGDRVPADARLLESMSLEAGESVLTGESMPVSKDAGLVLKQEAAMAERKNLVFMGTFVTRGLGKAVVTATGMQTEFGKIAAQVQSVEEEPTPLQAKLEAVGKRLAQAALLIVVAVFAVGLWRGFPLVEMFVTSVSLAVAAVPEGLPAVMTIALAIGVQRMAKRNAVVRKLRAAEALGSASVICTDKTGTLTRNEMTVRRVFFNGSDILVSGVGYSRRGDFTCVGKPFNSAARGFPLFLRAAALRTSAELDELADEEQKVLGDPTEGALLVLAAKGGLTKQAELDRLAKVYELPFESERKMMSVVYEAVGHSGRVRGRVAFVKGAPEAVLSKCDRMLVGGKERLLTPGKKRLILQKNDEYASEALRVLAIAYKPEVPKARKYGFASVEQKLVFLGLAAMIDPPREEAKQALALCREAGIRVMMITGDNPVTAQAIAFELGMGEGSRPKAVTGPQIDGLGEDEFEQVVRTTNVFARVSPEHKLRIVSALKKQGAVVAMTGDGVNDAPALKKADIGIAMGITGTDVSKEAADMVLADDNFATIVAAVEEGRVIYANILKTVYFLLSCNLGELGVVFAAAVLSLPLPLLPIQILWMNLVTDGLPALALGVDSPEPNVMRAKPRPKGEEILSKHQVPYLLATAFIIAFGTLALFTAALGAGAGLGKARTIAFTAIVAFELFHALNSRSRTHSLFSPGIFRNKLLWLAFVSALVLQVLIVSLPAGQAFFGTQALSLAEWALVLVASSSVLWLYEAWKWHKRRSVLSAK